MKLRTNQALFFSLPWGVAGDAPLNDPAFSPSGGISTPSTASRPASIPFREIR